MLKIGEKVPNFQFDAYHDNQFKTMSLDEFKGKWLVLLFYPADFTFVCPTELEEAANYYPEFQKAGAELVSFSTDTKYTHLAWHDTSKAIGKIKYPMGADPTGTICKAFGTYIDDAGLSLRGTFIIDPDGVLKTIDIHDNSIGRSSKEILRRVKAADYVRKNPAEVCPASWEPGAETLKPGEDLVGKI
jgi:peroxiredoxin (alkyl hydroperoxide reductase subunit C)